MDSDQQNDDSANTPTSNGMKDEIEYDDFVKLDVRIGIVVSAEKIEGADELIKCTVDFGELGERTIVSGILRWKSPEDMVGKQFPYVVNLKPRVLRGVESQGMLLAMSFNGESDFSFLVPEESVPPGTTVV